MLVGYHLARVEGFEHRLEGEFIVEVGAYGRAFGNDGNFFRVEQNCTVRVAEADCPPVAPAPPDVLALFQIAGYDTQGCVMQLDPAGPRNQLADVYGGLPVNVLEHGDLKLKRKVMYFLSCFLMANQIAAPIAPHPMRASPSGEFESPSLS